MSSAWRLTTVLKLQSTFIYIFTAVFVSPLVYDFTCLALTGERAQAASSAFDFRCAADLESPYEGLPSSLTLPCQGSTGIML